MTRALSIRQPWAHHILHSGKDIENRPRRTNFRGEVLIHASMKAEPGTLPEMRRGGIVGIMRIVGCVSQSDSPWFHGPFGYVITEARPLPFLRCTGQLGFFNVPEGVHRDVVSVLGRIPSSHFGGDG